VIPRRDGDIEKVYADTGTANRELGWQAETTLKETIHENYKRLYTIHE
jgi:UDP-glucose 4-epimerase